jgi:ribosome biogenesis ATPase
MQGLWTTHRRSKINLNSPAPSGANSPLATPLAETPKADTPQTEPVAGSSKPTEQPSETPNSPAAPSKRKTRLLREDSTPKRARTSTNTVPGSSNPNSIAKDYSPPTTRLSDLGGVDASIEKLLELVAMPLCHPEIYLYTGVQPPRGVLLQGPPGCGKTLLANAIAGVSVILMCFG